MKLLSYATFAREFGMEVGSMYGYGKAGEYKYCKSELIGRTIIEARSLNRALSLIGAFPRYIDVIEVYSLGDWLILKSRNDVLLDRSLRLIAYYGVFIDTNEIPTPKKVGVIKKEGRTATFYPIEKGE